MDDNNNTCALSNIGFQERNLRNFQIENYDDQIDQFFTS